MASDPQIVIVRRQRGGGIASGGQLRAKALEHGFRAAGEVEIAYAGVSDRDDDFEDACSSAALWGAWRRLQADVSPALSRLVKDADVVVLEDMAAFWLTGIADWKRAIVDIDNVRSQFWHQSLGRGSLPKRAAKILRYRWARWSERALLRRFRFALVCSEDDRAYFRSTNVRVVPNCAQLHPLMSEAPEGNPPLDLLFVGTLFYAPNIEGLKWFVDWVFPHIRLRIPDVRLTVVGRSPSSLPHDWGWLHSPGIEMLGTVPDVGPYVRSAKLEICPLLLGGGTRIKLIEALAFGTPAVATTVGAYGLSASETHGLYRRDTPEAFAAKCVELLVDGSGRSAAIAARALVQAQYSPGVVDAEIARMVEAIARDPLTRS